MAPMRNPCLDQPLRSEAIAPMRKPLQCLLWFGSSRETHVKSRRNLTIIFAAKVCKQKYNCTNRVVKLDRKQGLSAIPTQEKKIQQRKGSHCGNIYKKKKGAGGAADEMPPIGMLPPTQEQKKAISANQMDKQ